MTPLVAQVPVVLGGMVRYGEWVLPDEGLVQGREQVLEGEAEGPARLAHFPQAN